MFLETKSAQVTCFMIGLLLWPANGFAQSAPWATFAAGSHLKAILTSGRTVSGQLDLRTTPEVLWLTAQSEGITIGNQLKLADVLRIEPGLTVALPSTVLTKGVTSTLGISTHNRTSFVPIKSLDAFARLANLDSDAQPDGLQAILVPRGAGGEALRKAGSLTIKLSVYRGDWRNRTQRFYEEETWSKEVSVDDYTQQGLVINLPFRRITPETDSELLDVGVLNIRFNVASERSVDAQVEEVPLRSRSLSHEILTRP